VIVLCGAQHAEPSLPRVLRELGVTGPVSLVTAGWQEREGEPGVVADPGVPVVELALHQRGDDVFAHDAELASAYKARQLRLKLMQDFYRVRLDHAAQAARAVAVRHAEPDLIAEEWVASLAVIRQIDRDHLDRCRAVHAGFEAAQQPRRHAALARHLAELRALIEPTQALVIAGGHVAVLLNRLKLFGLERALRSRPTTPPPAGAMALAERIVLFHDHPPQGAGNAELFEAGLAVVRGTVFLPHAATRLATSDVGRVALLARRFAPAACYTLDDGSRLLWRGGRLVAAAGSHRLTRTGRLVPAGAHP
jgi:hypothetical protein